MAATALAIRRPAVEADDATRRRLAGANSAALDVLTSRTRLDRETLQQFLRRMERLQSSLRIRLLSADGGLTDFRRSNLRALIASVDQIIANAKADLAAIARRSYDTAADLGDSNVTESVRAAGLTITSASPAVDVTLVQTAFDNTASLLTPAMQDFAVDVQVAIRQVALAGDSRFEALQRLRDTIAGAGFAGAQYRAERIIRTELSRVFNQATFARLQSLAQQFPFIRKGWRDSRDGRVRIGHSGAGKTYKRGQGIPVDDPFLIDVYDERGPTPTLIGTAQMLFPVDPDATPAGRIAAAATIMCRCNLFVDYDIRQYAAFTKARLSLALGQVGG